MYKLCTDQFMYTKCIKKAHELHHVNLLYSCRNKVR